MRVREMLFAAALVAPTAMSAQMSASVAWPVAAGSRVRILSPVTGDQQQVGTVRSATADTLFFLPKTGTSTIAISTPNLARMEISTGTHTRKWKGAGIGFVIGAVAGAALGAATYKKQEGFYVVPDTRSFDATLGGVLLGTVGAVLGAVVGAQQVDTWVPVALPHAPAP